MNYIWTPDNFHGFSFGYVPTRTFISSAIGGGSIIILPEFISTWDTTKAGSANNTVVLPLLNGGSYNFSVDWGDGNSNTITGYNQPEVTHVYGQTGIYTIKINGAITGWKFNNGGDRAKILQISDVGTLAFTTGNDAAFFGCSNLTFTSTGSLILPVNATSMFRLCNALSTGGNFNSYDTSRTTNMLNLFRSSSSFNQNIGSWQTSGVTNMSFMFFDATGFNNGGSSSISGWNTSRVTNMSSMFGSLATSSAFNQPIGSWNTSSVTNMNSMFYYATRFNQNIGSWQTSGVTDMASMFNAASIFNNGGSSSISGWNTSNVTNMSRMFAGATSFNQPIGSWNTSKLTDISYMLNNADAFNQDLSNWTVTGITTATNFMQNASGLSTRNYDRTLSGWAQQSGNLQSGVSIHFGGSKYSIATGQVYRNILIAKGWTITDSGSV